MKNRQQAYPFPKRSDHFFLRHRENEGLGWIPHFPEVCNLSYPKKPAGTLIRGVRLKNFFFMLLENASDHFYFFNTLVENSSG